MLLLFSVGLQRLKTMYFQVRESNFVSNYRVATEVSDCRDCFLYKSVANDILVGWMERIREV